MDKFISTSLGGIPRTLDDLRHFLGQDGGHGIYQALNNMLGAFGTDYIVQGCIVTGTSPTATLSEGWIVLGSELLKVAAVSGTLDTSTNEYFAKVTTYKTSGLKTLQSSSTAETYEQARGTVSASSGQLSVLTGARYKDQFDVWKSFDVTGINDNFVANDADFGGGSDVPLHQEVLSNTNFKYKIVGKTVYWTFQLTNFHLPAFNTNQVFSLVIRNLPWTAKVPQYQSVKIRTDSNNGFVSGTALLAQQATESRMTVTMFVFDSASIAMNRKHAFATTTSMSVLSDSSLDAQPSKWIARGSGAFEIE